MTNIYLSLCVDDLDARDDPERSDRIAAHHCSVEETKVVLDVIKSIKARLEISTNIVGCMSPEAIEACDKSWDRNHPFGE